MSGENDQRPSISAILAKSGVIADQHEGTQNNQMPGSVLIRMERGCVGDQPQQFERAAADALRTAALRENFKSGRCQML
jgi:hypothetical protein